MGGIGYLVRLFFRESRHFEDVEAFFAAANTKVLRPVQCANGVDLAVALNGEMAVGGVFLLSFSSIPPMHHTILPARSEKHALVISHCNAVHRVLVLV